MKVKKICKGRIAVYSPTHELKESETYNSEAGMKNIMARWMDEYCYGFYIQVSPHIPGEEKPDPIILKILNKPKEEKIQRPPAVYSKIPVYNYNEK